MTASSVGLFACRVQPIGLPPAAASNAPFNNSTSSNATTSSSISIRQPPMRHMRSPPSSTAVRRVSRNLFGKPERSEIDQMMRTECERNCAYMRERYNFDIRTSGSQQRDATTTTTEVGVVLEDQTALPTLIEQELQMQAAKRQKKSDTTTTTTTPIKNINEITITTKEDLEELQHITFLTPTAAIPVRKCCTALQQQRDHDDDDDEIKCSSESYTNVEPSSNDLSQKVLSTTTTAPTSTATTTTTTCSNSPQQQRQVTLCNAVNRHERHKINAKQTLITDCFNVRKTTAGTTALQHLQHKLQEQQAKLDVALAPASVLLSVKITTTKTAATDA